MTSILDKLLTDASTRDVVLQALKALEEGGAVITDNIKDRGNRKQMEAALEEYGARYSSSRGYWKKKSSSSDHSKSKRVKSSEESPINEKETVESESIPKVPTAAVPSSSSSSAQQPLLSKDYSVQRPVYGVAMPPPNSSSARDDNNGDGDDDDDNGPLPATHGNYRKPVAASSHADANPGQKDSRPRREEWMSQELKETDPTRLLRLKAMTSQSGRTFNNYKSATGEMVLPGADSRSTATGKIDDSSRLASGGSTAHAQQQTGFHWNHEEMMGVDKVDKQRLNRVLSENINSRFAPASRKFL